MRAWLTTGLCALILTPVPVLGWLGVRGIGTLEREGAQLRGQELSAALSTELATSLERLVADSRPVDGLSFTTPWLPLRSEQLQVSMQPDGQEFGDLHLHQARMHQTAGRSIEALEALDPLLAPGASPSHRALASVVAASLLTELGRADHAETLLSRARARLEVFTGDERAGRWLRWLSLREAELLTPETDGSERRDRWGRAVQDWWAEVESRATNIEELVLLADLQSRTGDDASVLDQRLDRRRRMASWAAILEGVATEPGARRLTSLQGEWFVIEDRVAEPETEPATIRDNARRFRRVEGVQDWLQAWRSDDGLSLTNSPPEHGPTVPLPGRLLDSDTELDLSSVNAWLPARGPALFGAVDPRWVLAGGLALYLVVGLVLVRAIRVQARRSELLLRTREDLIAQILHELRTPLTVLRMYSESLLQGRVPEQARQQYLQTIDQESRRLGELVDRVAEMARSDATSPRTTAAPLDPVPVLRRVVSHYREIVSADAGDASLETDFHGHVRMDEEDLRQVLEIVLDNSVRYTSAPAQLRVSCRPDRDRAVCIRVTDNGPGVPVDERPHLFERFFRGESGRNSGRRGAGMGLALARQTAMRAGGTLDLEFPNEGGTVAILTLPIARDPGS